MQTTIGVIQKSKFDKSNYDPVIQDAFTEILHRNTAYMYINTFEKYTSNYPFDQVFSNTEEYEAWLIYVPPFISKLQAVSLMLQIGKYNDMLAALDLDPTGVKRILFEAAHQFDRNSSMVNEMGLVLGFTEIEMDDFFVNADKILV